MSGILRAGDPQLRLVRPQRRRSADHLSAAGRSAGARVRLFLRHRAGARSEACSAGLFNFDRVVGGAGVALLMSGLAVIVATGDLIHLRRQRLLRSVWAAARGRAGACAVDRDHVLPAMDRQRRSADLAAGERDRAFLRRQFRAANQPAAARGGRRSAAGELHRDGQRASASVARRHAGNERRGCRSRNSTRPAAWWSGAPPTHRARHRADIAQRFPGLVPEVPRAFEWLVNGRQPLLRVGWAIVRPKQAP